MGSIQRPLTSTRGSRTKKASGREDVQKGDAGQAAAQALKRTLIVRALSPRRVQQRRHGSAAEVCRSPRPAHAWLNSTMIGIQTLVTEIETSGGAAGGAR